MRSEAESARELTSLGRRGLWVGIWKVRRDNICSSSALNESRMQGTSSLSTPACQTVRVKPTNHNDGSDE